MNAITSVPAPAPGVYDGMPAEHYHSTPAVSVSTLKTFADAPAKARYGERRETNSLSFGSLVHCAVLEPNALEHRYCVTDLTRISEREKATQAEMERAAGRELVKRPEWEEALRIREAVHAHPVAGEILSHSLQVEQSAFWIDDETGLLCRARADGLRPDLRVIVDLKSTADASPRGFARSVAEYRYQWQDAFYRDGFHSAAGWDPEAFVFLAVEKEPPFLVAAYELDPADVGRGRERVHQHLAAYAECQRSGVWPGYSDTLEPLVLPEWAHR